MLVKLSTGLICDHLRSLRTSLFDCLETADCDCGYESIQNFSSFAPLFFWSYEIDDDSMEQ
jgi:hypothetical protein